MDKPDLAALAHRTETLIGAIDDLRTEIDEAHNAALGETDPETDEVIVEENGDPSHYFEQAVEKTLQARLRIEEAQEILATVQGYRDFSDAGAVEVDG